MCNIYLTIILDGKAEKDGIKLKTSSGGRNSNSNNQKRKISVKHKIHDSCWREMKKMHKRNVL